MEFQVKIQNYQTEQKVFIGDNSFFYRMVTPQNESAILKVTKIPKINIFCFNPLYEAEIIQKLSKFKGFCQMIDCGLIDEYSYCLMSEQGISLESLKGMCGERFSLKTTLMILDQMLERIQVLHSQGLTHSFLTPDHFLLGLKQKSKTLFLVSFSYAQVLKNGFVNDPDKIVIEFSFMSRNQLEGKPVQMKDDLESLLYMAIYFLKGNLPWSELVSSHFSKSHLFNESELQGLKTQHLKQKILTPLDEVCAGIPKEFLDMLRFCRECRNDEVIDIDWVRETF